MRQLGRAPCLIRYDTENGFEGAKKAYFRPSLLLYGALLFVLLASLAIMLSVRTTADALVIRDAADGSFAVIDERRITNHLHLHLANKSDQPQVFKMQVVAPAEVELIVPTLEMPVAAGSTATIPLFFNVATKQLIKGKLPIAVRITSDQGFEKVQKLVLLGPG